MEGMGQSLGEDEQHISISRSLLTFRYRTQPTSHPVGTTVRITDFLKHIPVRRQTALKNAGKTLVRIKGLLQSYAISQPSKKLSLKILKANNTRSDWLYAPGSEPSLLDAALKVVGREVCSSGILKQLSSQPTNETETKPLDRKVYQVVAFLPNIQFGKTTFIYLIPGH